MTQGKIIRKARRDKEITQKELADACGVAQSFIANIENGKKKLPESCKKTISNLLKIEIE